MSEWISVKDRMPDIKKVLAIFVSDPKQMYNMRHDGWFRDTIYACRMREDKFVIESHGPVLTATHWMPQPRTPKELALDELTEQAQELGLYQDQWIEFKHQMPKNNQMIKVRSGTLWHGEGIFQDGRFVYSSVKGACFGNPTHWMDNTSN